MELFHQQRTLYAVTAIAVMIVQAVVLDTVSSFILRLVRRDPNPQP